MEDTERGTYQTPQWKLPSVGTDVQREAEGPSGNPANE